MYVTERHHLKLFDEYNLRVIVMVMVGSLLGAIMTSLSHWDYQSMLSQAKVHVIGCSVEIITPAITSTRSQSSTKSIWTCILPEMHSRSYDIFAPRRYHW